MNARIVRTCGTVAGLVAATALIAGCQGVTDAAAHDRLLETLGSTTVTVYPTVIRTREVAHDGPSAARLAVFLEAEDLATPVLSDQAVPISGPWHRNQARMLRESIETLAAFVRANPIETDHALMAEYLLGPSEAGGIHCYMLDADGTVALAVLLNSHHAVFADAEPRTAEDCTAVLIDVLEEELEKRG